MPIATIKLDSQDKANPELERAGKESQAVRIVTSDGQVFIVFPEDGFDRMCEVIQSGEFAKALEEGAAEYKQGRAKLVRSKNQSA